MKTWQRWVFTTGVAAFLVASAEAETVLWYQLDVLDIGVTSTLSTVIDNIANPGMYQMHCHSLVGINRGVVPEYMPSGTVGMPSGIWVYDPVTQEGGERLNAMHFGLTEIPPGTKSANGAMLRTDTSNPSNLGLTNVTVEAIFRTSAGALTDWSMAPIVYLPGVNNDGYKESVMLGIGWSGKLACRFNAEGTSRVVGGGSGPLVTPDVWHHAAFTLDAEGTGRLYLDYQLVHSLSGLGSLDQVPNKPLMIGANTHVAERTFPGDILEVRINDTAIGSGEFLQVRVPPRVTPDDTILFCPDMFGFNYRFGSLVNVNTATGAFTRITNPMSETNSPPAVLDTINKAGDAFRFGINDAAGVVANTGSTHSVRNETGSGSGVKIMAPNSEFEKASFTMECFFKTPGAIDGETWTFFYSPCVKVCLGDDGKILGRGFQAQGDYSTVLDIKSKNRVDDGTWHHLAFVYDIDAAKTRLYVDYALQGSHSVTLGTTGAVYPSAGVQNIAGHRQYFPGWIDELRITRRALGPEEFMLADPAGAPGVLVHLTFDNSDYMVEPYPSLNPAGAGFARVTAGDEGNVPAFSSVVRPKVALDGEAELVTKQNVKSLYMDASQVRYPHFTSLHGKTSFTIEWFMNLSACATNAGLLRLSRTTTTFEGHDPAPTWRVYVRPTSKKALDFEACETTQQKYITTWTAFPDDIDDGRWHHYAITVEKINVSGLTKTELRLYRDYVSHGSQQFTGIIKYPDDDACAFTIGADNNFTGYIDEVRITDGVLPVSSFMRSMPTGTSIILR
ncbi:MAG TPA: LamG domain-containing protein [Kiritimatiellia bacterium]|nr:LamG domain-containing protein [Kiritimatiellia bacterium]